MTRSVRIASACAVLLLALAPASGQVLRPDPDIPEYRRNSAVSGSLDSIGSDMMSPLMTLWREGFLRMYPNVRVRIEGGGSSGATAALIEGKARIAPMSRAMRMNEVASFKNKRGYQPTQLRVAVDALVVFVNAENPLDRLTLPQIDAIFSSSRDCEHPNLIRTWGEAGLEGEWSQRTIRTFGPDEFTEAHDFFESVVLCGGDFREDLDERPGAASVVLRVGEDRAAIGFGGIGHGTVDVKNLKVSAWDGAPYHSPHPQVVLSGRYPLSRVLYLHIDKIPGQPLDPLVREFVKFVLSRDGQEIVAGSGRIPLPSKLISNELEKLR